MSLLSSADPAVAAEPRSSGSVGALFSAPRREREAAHALRAAASAVPTEPPPCWQRLGLTILAVGALLGTLLLALLVVLLLWPGPLLVVPAAAALAGVIRVTVRDAERKQAERAG